MNISLKMKLIFSFFVLIVAAVSVLGVMSYKMASEALQDVIEQSLRHSTDQAAESISRTLTNAEGILDVASKNNSLAKTAARTDGASGIESFQFISQVQSENKALFERLIIVDARGRSVMDSENQVSNTDLSDRDYVQESLRGKDSTSEVIISKFTDKPVVAVAHPLELEGKIVGALVGTINFNGISEHAAEVEIGETGYAYMLDRQGLIVYHPKKDKILVENLSQTSSTELKTLVEKMKQGETGEGFYTYEGVYKFVRFEPAGKWIVAVTANFNDYMAPALTIRNRTLAIVIIATIIALIIAYLVSAGITNPIRQLQSLMELAGQGDLTVSSEIKTRDEIKALGDSFNVMISSQSKIVSEVRNNTQELSAGSQEMAASSEQISSATQQIGASMQQVAADAERQNASIVDASKALIELSSLVQMAENKAVSANESSMNTMKTAQDGRAKVKEMVGAMDIIREKSDESARVIDKLNELSSKIGEIVTTINAIADQTNMLALNAAIEAARAGEHGKGFAVVAEEVRKLAEESNQGANEIATLIHEMGKQTGEAVQSMDEGKYAVDNGVQVVNSTDETFADIINAVDSSVRSIKEIEDITKAEVATSDQVVKLIDAIASVAEATAAASEEVSSAAEEQTAAVETLSSTAQQTSSMANDLEELVQKFKV